MTGVPHLAILHEIVMLILIRHCEMNTNKTYLIESLNKLPAKFETIVQYDPISFLRG